MNQQKQKTGANFSGGSIYFGLGLLTGAAGFLVGGLAWGMLGSLVGVLAAEVFFLRTRLSRLEAQVAHKARQEPAGTEVVFQPLQDQQEARKQETEQAKQIGMDFADTGSSATEEPLVEKYFRNIGDFGRTCKKYTTEFFTTGNLVLKTGVLVLFFGVAFLLKYAAQRNMLPVEFRLVGVALGGTILLGLGWRLRLKRSGYGLTLQGGGIGLLYLVIFAAAKLYGFLPMMLALSLMTVLVVFSCMLALLQGAKSLAVFAIVGGFLAPVLMSSSEGSHVLLFSYYGLLNAGILGIAWFKAWRELNLIGFVFTFVIGTLWGASGYQPEHFFSTEPFLLLFFLFYVVISVLFGHRQPINLRGFIDGPLVFGLPLVVSGLQYCLVREFHYGMAFSALGFGLFYLVMASLLWRRRVESMHLLCEAFLALGIMFGSLAIPLAFEGHLSASIWALEGAAMVWVGARQKRQAARVFGLLLQAAAAFIFVDSVWYPFSALPFANRYFLGCFFLAAACLFSSNCLDTHGLVLKKWERSLPLPLMISGLIWWYIGGLREVDHQMMRRDVIHGIVLFICASSILSALIARKLSWRRLEAALLVQLPAMTLLVLFSLPGTHGASHLFRGWGVVAWIFGFATQYRILYFYAETWKNRVRDGYHLATMWLMLFVLCREADWYVENFAGVSGDWSLVCWGIIPAGTLLLLLRLGNSLFWPVGRYPSLYLAAGGLLPAAGLCCWLIFTFSIAGDPWPLVYIPVLNPIELAGLAVIATLVLWVLNRRKRGYELRYLPEKHSLPALGLLFFLWMNCVVARAVHFYGGIPYSPESLYRSVVFQASVAALWGAAALGLTVWATKKHNRPLWAAGAILLGMVVVKLFLVDLSGTGTIARIVSFLVVGLLMLVIGYFSPLPPRQQEETK